MAINTRLAVLLVAAAISLAGCMRERKLSSDSEGAVRSYTNGVSLWQKFYYPEARTAFEQAIAQDSAFAMAWCRLAVVKASSRDMDGAKIAMGRALSLATDATLREQLFISMWNRRINYDNVGAARAADSLLQFYPEEEEGYLFRGNLYEELDKDYDAAVRFYQKAVDADTGYAQAVMSLGYAYSNLGDQQRAVEQMQRYIALAPDAADPRASYADILVRAGRYDEALEQYGKSLAIKPDYWYSVRQIGVVYEILGRLTAAREQYHKSFTLLPGPRVEASRLIAEGSLNINRAKFAVAADQFRAALTIDSTSGSAAYGLVYALVKLKQFDDARGTIERIRRELEIRNLTRSPAMLGFHLTRARLLAEEKKTDEALAACDSALEFSVPLTRPPVYRQMAEIQLARGSFENAMDACEEALSVNPNDPDALLTLTKIYHRKGDASMTVEIGSRLLAIWSGADPDFADRIELLRILGKKAPL